jgi:hypothetical protein
MHQREKIIKEAFSRTHTILMLTLMAEVGENFSCMCDCGKAMVAGAVGSDAKGCHE